MNMAASLSALRPLRRAFLGILSLVLIVCVWWVVTTGLHLFTETLLPSPSAVLKAFAVLLSDGTLIHYTLVSLGRVAKGFGIAVLISIPLAAIIASSSVMEELIEPVIEIMRPVPPLAIIPLSILWFGIGEASKVSIIIYGAFFPMIVNNLAGFRTVDPQLVRAVRSLGASDSQAFWHVNLHSAFGHIVVGMRLGLAMGFLVLVGAELIAAEAGLGFLINDARLRFRSDEIMVGIITVGFVGFLLNASRRCVHEARSPSHALRRGVKRSAVRPSAAPRGCGACHREDARRSSVGPAGRGRDTRPAYHGRAR